MILRCGVGLADSVYMFIHIFIPVRQFVSTFVTQVLVDYGLSKNQALEVLDLRANQLSGMAAIHLARLLQENSSIQVLHLASNRISDEGVLVRPQSSTLYKASACPDCVFQPNYKLKNRGR